MLYLQIHLKITLKGAKLWWPLVQLYKDSFDCFALEVSTDDTVSRLCRVYIAIQDKETKISYYSLASSR